MKEFREDLALVHVRSNSQTQSLESLTRARATGAAGPPRRGQPGAGRRLNGDAVHDAAPLPRTAPASQGDLGARQHTPVLQMLRLMKHNLEETAAAAAKQLAEAEASAPERPDPAAVMPVPPAREPLPLGADFLFEPLFRPLDMLIRRTKDQFDIFGVGVSEKDHKLLMVANPSGRSVLRLHAFIDGQAGDTLGELRNNMAGTSFTLCGVGHDSSVHASVVFSRKSSFSSAPRTMTCVLENYPDAEYQNRQPVKAPGSGGFVIDFEIDAVVPSTKNFSLTLDGLQDIDPTLELVKRGPDEFAMRCRPPISPFQAFGVALSSLKHKLAVA
eukprot:COSAG05_NODE_1477_length_4781_cov_6.449381_2_plen_329_part_00